MPLHSAVLYSSVLATVRDVVCTENCGRGRHEECSPINGLVLVRRGAFMRRDRLGRHLADPLRVLFFKRDDVYTTDHPLPGGDRCTLLEFPDALLHEVAGPALAWAVLAGGANLQLAHRTLLRAAQQRDSLRVDETALRILQLCSGENAAVRPTAGAAGRARELADALRVLMVARFDERLTLEQLARAVGVSPFRLCREFHAASGETLHAHLTKLRLTVALERLPEYRQRLTRLALDLGFSSHSHFTQAFRRRYGLTPDSYLRAA